PPSRCSNQNWSISTSTGPFRSYMSARDPAEKPRELPHEGGVIRLFISSDSRWLVTGGWRNTVRGWDLKAPAAPPRVFRGHAKFMVKVVRVSPDNRWLVAGGWADGIVLLRSLTDERPVLEPVKQLRAHDGGVAALAISADSRWLLTGGADKSARLWDLTAETPAAHPAVRFGSISGIGFLVPGTVVTPFLMKAITSAGFKSGRRLGDGRTAFTDGAFFRVATGEAVAQRYEKS